MCFIFCGERDNLMVDSNFYLSKRDLKHAMVIKLNLKFNSN